MKRLKHGLMAIVAVGGVALAGFFWFQIRQDAKASVVEAIPTAQPGDEKLGKITFVAPEKAPEDARLAGLTVRGDGARLLWLAEGASTILEAGFADTQTVVISATTSAGYRVFAIDLGSHATTHELTGTIPRTASGHRQMLANADRFCDSEPNERGVMDLTCYNASWANPKRLTTHDGPEDLVNPAISPDGAWIVFEVSTLRMKKTSTTLGNTIWRIGLNGANLQQLTRGADDRNPTWSEDGSRIYFQRLMSDGNWDMYAMSGDGGNPNSILRTLDQDERWVNRVPGEKSVVTVVSASGTEDRVRKINLETKSGEWLTGGTYGPDTHASVSPDGKFFSFIAPIDSADPKRLGVWLKALE